MRTSQPTPTKPPQAPPRGPEPRRVLLIRPSALGDVCRTVPLAVSLKAAFPSCTLDWLVQDAFVGAVQAHPAVDHVVPFPRKDLGRLAGSLRLGDVAGWLNRTLRDPGYDLVIDAQGLLRSGLFAWWTRAPRRIGPSDAREGARLAYTSAVRSPDGLGRAHTVDRMLDLVAAVGATPVRDLRLYAPPEARAWAAEEPALRARFAVLAPTSRWPGKRWPAERFAIVATELLARGYDRVVIVGAGGEKPQCGPLLQLAAQDGRVVDMLGRTSVSQLLALIERASLVIANDSAALHIAVGYDRPMIALFGPTRIDLVGPYRREADVIQHLEPGETEHLSHKDDASGRELMERISVADVLRRVPSG